MSNFSQMSNSFAQGYINQNCDGNAIWEQIKNYVTQTTGGELIPDRSTAFVGTDPDHPESSYVIVIAPTFKDWSLNDPSHQSGSVMGYFSEGKASFVGSIATVEHNPFQIASMTLVERGTDGNLAPTTLQRAEILGSTVEDLAEIITNQSTAVYQEGQYTSIRTTVPGPDLGAMIQTAMNEFTTDSYGAPLYPPTGLTQILNDGAVATVFGQAAALRTAQADDSLSIVVCTSTSCNGCTSSSSTIEIEL